MGKWRYSKEKQKSFLKNITNKSKNKVFQNLWDAFRDMVRRDYRSFKVWIEKKLSKNHYCKFWIFKVYCLQAVTHFSSSIILWSSTGYIYWDMQACEHVCECCVWINIHHQLLIISIASIYECSFLVPSSNTCCVLDYSCHIL